MKPSSIVVAVLVLLAVPPLVWMLGPGATWVLENIDHATVFAEDKDRAAALATIRGNVLAMATGLAALLAVFNTARNADTARRTFQLGERGHDTDRFSKAVEQLGSGQAPVRLGGLYALEQLAQNNPALRQTIVDVICAYLRMPWTPPRNEDRPKQIRTAHTGAPARVNRDPAEERQVRLTGQRVLADHLRWQKHRWRQGPTAANPLFWPGIRLDLSGASLLDAGFGGCRFDQADFRGATFTDLVRSGVLYQRRLVQRSDLHWRRSVWGGDLRPRRQVLEGRLSRAPWASSVQHLRATPGSRRQLSPIPRRFLAQASPAPPGSSRRPPATEPGSTGRLPPA